MRSVLHGITLALHSHGGVPLSLGIGSVIRAVSIIMIEKSVRQALAEVEDHKHE